MAALTCLRNLSRIVAASRFNSAKAINLPIFNASKNAHGRWIHQSTILNAERKYSKEHEWVSMENGVGTIGISKYAQEKLGDVVYVSLPDVSETITTDEEFGILESVKAANDLFAPVSGEVIEINDDVLDRPSLVNSSPFEEGWLIKVRLSNKKELNNLMSESEYEDFTGGLNQ